MAEFCFEPVSFQKCSVCTSSMELRSLLCWVGVRNLPSPEGMPFIESGMFQLIIVTESNLLGSSACTLSARLTNPKCLAGSAGALLLLRLSWELQSCMMMLCPSGQLSGSCLTVGGWKVSRCTSKPLFLLKLVGVQTGVKAGCSLATGLISSLWQLTARERGGLGLQERGWQMELMYCWLTCGEVCEVIDGLCSSYGRRMTIEVGASSRRLELGLSIYPLISCGCEGERSIVCGNCETALSLLANWDTGAALWMDSLCRLSTRRKVVICSGCATKRGEAQGTCEEDCEAGKVGCSMWVMQLLMRSVSYLPGLSSMLFSFVGILPMLVTLLKFLSSPMACQKFMRSAVRQRKFLIDGFCCGMDCLSIASSRHQTRPRTISSWLMTPPFTSILAHFAPAHTFTTPRSLMPMQSLSTGKQPMNLARSQQPVSAWSQRCSASGKGMSWRSHSRMGIFSRQRYASYLEAQNSACSLLRSSKYSADTHFGLFFRTKESSLMWSYQSCETVLTRWRSMCTLRSWRCQNWVTSVKGLETSRQLDWSKLQPEDCSPPIGLDYICLNQLNLVGQ